MVHPPRTPDLEAQRLAMKLSLLLRQAIITELTFLSRARTDTRNQPSRERYLGLQVFWWH
jgi:hypothetical protein